MLIPLAVLAVGSIFSGLFGSKFLHMVSVEDNFFGDSILVLEKNHELLEEVHHSQILVQYAPLILGIIAIFLAYIFYVKKTNLPKKLAETFKIAYKISFNKWYFDEIYEAVLVKPTKSFGNFLWKIIDMKIVDGGPNGAALFCKTMAKKVGQMQTGLIYNYALWMVLGLITILFFLITSLKQLMLS